MGGIFYAIIFLGGELMRQDEFVERHGQDVWDRLVGPMQERGRAKNDNVKGAHANIIVHDEIMRRLRSHGIADASGLLQVSEEMRETVAYETTFALT